MQDLVVDVQENKSVSVWNVRNQHFQEPKSCQPYNNHTVQKIGRTRTGQSNSPFGKKGVKQL